MILIDDNAGFCFGVVKAIDAAERELSRSGQLHCLGNIVHNSAEVNRLRTKGLSVISHDDLSHLREGRVLIRAHGEPPSTYEMAKQKGITLIDATCPIVLALQQRIRRGFLEMQKVGGQVVIFGKPGHAEVIGLTGQTDNTALVVSDPDEWTKLDFSLPIRLYSQTTKSKEHYQQLIANIQSHLPENADFKAFDTICSRVTNRVEQLQQFARSVEVLLFVSGEESSNGRYLFQYCLNVQPNTHFVSDISQIQSSWFHGKETVGITGATSTPRWLMERVAEYLKQCI